MLRRLGPGERRASPNDFYMLSEAIGRVLLPVPREDLGVGPLAYAVTPILERDLPATAQSLLAMIPRIGDTAAYEVRAGVTEASVVSDKTANIVSFARVEPLPNTEAPTPLVHEWKVSYTAMCQGSTCWGRRSVAGEVLPADIPGFDDDPGAKRLMAILDASYRELPPPAEMAKLAVPKSAEIGEVLACLTQLPVQTAE